MWEACEALRDALLVLGPGIDGGKDSLSMAAKVIAVSVLFSALSLPLFDSILIPFPPFLPLTVSFLLFSPSPPPPDDVRLM